MTGLEYAESRAHADRIGRQFNAALRHVDLLLTPATPYPAPRADQEEVVVAGGVVDVHRGGPSRLTVPVNEAAVPAVAFPIGTSRDGLPLGRAAHRLRVRRRAPARNRHRVPGRSLELRASSVPRR
jgi:Asp-tRNA(Asn)/Glu-tRNA(Gln) amidotransferase A subunit family amidase